MNVVSLVIDRLSAGYVGAYGNTWIETPNLDRLACQSLLLENALIDSPDLERLYRSYWLGWHALCPEPPAESRPSLAASLGESDTRNVLLTDEPLLDRCPGAMDFDEVIRIDPPWQPETAGRIDQTHFSRCFERMIDRLASLRGPFMLWCHLGGLGTTWDAPPEFRRAYQEPGDPPPPEGAERRTGCSRPIATPTSCSASRRLMPDKCRCWTPVWARFWMRSTICRPPAIAC